MNINEYFNNVIIAIIVSYYDIIFMANILQTLLKSNNPWR